MLRAAHTEESARAPGSVQLLQPDTSHHATHRKSEQINRQIRSETRSYLTIEITGQLAQRDGSQAMGQMGSEQRPIRIIQGLDQPPKDPRRVPEAVHQNKRVTHRSAPAEE
jgi:hypothetical protein